MRKAYTLYLLMALLAAVVMACVRKPKPTTTPWGTEVADVDDNSSERVTDHESSDGITSLQQIMSNGEMIVLTISGPDTYYDYHGRGMGVQYLMCELFARRMGVTLRVEQCKDTTEMISKLNKGYGDIIAVQLEKRKYGDKKLRFCGAYEKKNGSNGIATQWAVNEKNKELASELDKWFKPTFPKLTLDYEDRLLAMAVTHSANWQPSGKAFAASRAEYDLLFQRYAPLAGLPWQLISAQCAQESGYDAGARSWAGACGLMQLMPSTAARFGLSREEIFNPEKNIEVACRLMGSLMREFSDVPHPEERISFALAAYNAGSGHVRDAMALAGKYGGNPHLWSSVEEYILRLGEPQYYQDEVVRHGFMRGRETYGYVRAIRCRY